MLARSYRRMMISRSSSAAVSGSLRIPRSSMISRGTVPRNSMHSLCVPSSVASEKFIKQRVRLAVEHAITLLNGGLADGLGQMAFAAAGRTEKQCVFVAGNEGTSGQVDHLWSAAPVIAII